MNASTRRNGTAAPAPVAAERPAHEQRIRCVDHEHREDDRVAVTVRLFAALREAAGVETVTVGPAPVRDIVAGLCDRFGEPFATRVRVASVLLDGTPVGLDATESADDGAELALLPPFSGGSAVPPTRPATGPSEGRVQVLLLVGTLLVPALLVAGALSGRWAVATVVAVIALASLLDLHVTLAGLGARTVLPGALLLAGGPVGLIILARPSVTSAWLTALLAIGVLSTMLLAVASRRRDDTALVVGSTAMSGLLVALGAGATLLLFDALQTTRMIAILVLIAATDAAAVVASGNRRRPAIRHVLPATAAVAVPAGIVVQSVAGRAGTVVPVIGFALIAVLAAIATVRLRQVLRPPAADGVSPPPALLVGTADGVLVAMPLTALWLQVL